MLHSFSRTELLLGTEALKKLNQSKVSIFGIGGVGTFAVEGLARSGVGKFVLVDDDTVCLTNINRQLHATRKTVGKPKVALMKDRILEINPKAEVTIYQEFYTAKTAQQLIHSDSNYIIDAIDTVSAKIDLIVRAKELGIPVISSMGAGNKLDPTKFEVSDIYKTTIDPLAKVMRRELRKRGIESLKVVYSKEEPLTPLELENTCKTECICSNKDRTCTVRRQIPGSVAWVPSVAGLIIAGEVVKDLIQF
ncbi:MAG: tRNA threonylcarbamoyladenosine dehydratase [Petroclostridium sp.]|jgi:tRNA A37 threonylcarbamoyladenosine dehydratase|uniref:tRNA threonylcarbamoyladenosine dehydratase n=1 Tax=Petroclostridium xylanilyticum TaxID=1792311 RepID=UPI000B997208|nr:tRNA threonylcarbamoyladenosine dehydratase [Petroclostridium xylanilyticum]MBZ4645545.1 tRNA cyclic N6-threonylcarbamoyladenosine(37) synthase TcdA [Clostridia bacterium]MDK2811187.1 tRNA threonylcarbamoyladenosine dehydratase [Petroclostridium sp.]